MQTFAGQVYVNKKVFALGSQILLSEARTPKKMTY